MNHSIAAAVAVLSLIVAGQALAQPACQGQGEPTVRLIVPPREGGANPDFRGVMERSLAQAEADKVDRSAPCRRGESIVVDGVTLRLTGNDGDEHPRRAVGPNPEDPLFFLNGDVDPGSIMRALLSGQQTINVSVRYVLVRMGPDGRQVIGVFNGLPTDEVLRRIITENIAVAREPQARVDVLGQNLQIMGASPRGATPAPGDGVPGGGGQLAGPDGVIFQDAGNGGARHRRTNFVCPRSIANLNRERLTVFDPSQDGRDVGCGYGQPESAIWHTIYLTHIPDMTPEAVFEEYRRQGQMVAPSARDAAPPLAVGEPPLPSRAAFWVDAQGRNQGIWVSSIGSWHVKIRTTFRNGREQEAAQFAREVFALFYEQVRPDSTRLARADLD